MAGAFNPFAQQFESGQVRALKNELEYLTAERETAKAVIAQLAGNGPFDILFIHPADVMTVINRETILRDVFLTPKSGAFNEEFTLGSSRIRIRQTPLMPEGVGLKELDRREDETKARLLAKQELLKALPLIEKLMKNPVFLEAAQKAGFKLDVPALFEAVGGTTGWKFSGNFFKK